MGDAVKKHRRVHVKRIHVLKSWHPVPQTVCIVPDAFLPKQYKANVTVRKKALSLTG